MLLLSNGEADVISELMWKAQRDGTKVPSGPTLMPFHVLRAHTVPSEGDRPITPSLLQSFGAATHPERVPAMSVAQLLRFNGDTQFGGSLRTILKQMLPSQGARKAALEIFQPSAAPVTSWSAVTLRRRAMPKAW